MPSTRGADSASGKVAVYHRKPTGIHNSSIAIPSGDVIEKTSEDEWITRRRVEVTTTKNIETRVQRQLLLEDGKIVEDSGPIISTDTTVDTTEKKDENTEGAPPAAKPSSSKSFFSWKPKLMLKRSKSLHAKKDAPKAREIRFGDEGQPGVILMSGVEHRRAGGGAPDHRPGPGLRGEPYVTAPAGGGGWVSQTLPRPPRLPGSPSRAKRAASVDALERRGPAGDAPPSSPSPPQSSPRRPRAKEPLRPTRSVSPFKGRPPSELSSSPAPRAPVWRASSDGSLTETITNLSTISVSKDRAKQGGAWQQRQPPRRTAKPAKGRDSDKPSVIDFIKRKLSIKPREKPRPTPVKRTGRASSSSTSSPERAVRRGHMKAAKSHDVLSAEQRPGPAVAGDADEQRYRSLPRSKQRAGGTTLSRKISSMGWGTFGRAQGERGRGPPAGPSRPPPERREPPPQAAPLAARAPDSPRPRPPPKQSVDSLRGRPGPSPDDEEPIQPIIQERRALSQPSLFFPHDEPPSAEEPFTLYANIPFQLPARRPASPSAAAVASSLKAKRAMSQPSLLEPRPPSPPSRSSADRSDTIYAYSPHQRGQRPAGPRPAPVTRTVWRPSITVKHKSILKRRKSTEPRPGDAPPAADGRRRAEPPRQGVLHGIAHNIRSVFKHKRNGDDRVPEGYVAVPGGAVVSERFTNITNTHEEKDDVREEEEVHHLGHYSNEEVNRAIRDGKDARALLRQRGGSGHSGQLVDPRSGQRRLVHQSGKTWRTVDTEDIHEKTHQDQQGEMITETARTSQHEQFHNVQEPDDSDMPDGAVQEAVRSSSHNRRHVKDVDMLEYYSLPKGGRLADGIKLGDGLRYVQENVEEDREGDDNIESLSERMRQLRQLGYKPEGQALAKTPIEYQEEEKTRRKETHKWLESHFGSESGQSQSSEEGEPRGRDEVDRRREFTSYEHKRTAGAARKTEVLVGAASREYSQQPPPERLYVRETRQTLRAEPERGFPAGSRASTDTQQDEDPIFSSKFSSGKPRGAGVRFQPGSPERRRAETGRLSPPTQSPPPPPPPRHRRKGGEPAWAQQAPPDNHYASSPIRERYERDLTPGRASEYRRDIQESYHASASPRHRRDREREHESPRRPAGRDAHRVVAEYRYRESESPRGSRRSPPREAAPGRREYREQRGSRGDSLSTDERDGRESPRRAARHQTGRAAFFMGQERRDRTASVDELGDGRERYVRYRQTETAGARHHRSTDQLDRRGGDDWRQPTRAAFDGGRAQTLPRKPHDYPPSPVARAPAAGRFGGSLINVSLKGQPRGGGPPAPQKPARSNSLYSKENADGRRPEQEFSAGLKSPDIISKIQRTTSMRRGEQAEGERTRRSADHELPSSSVTSSSGRSYRSPAAANGKKDNFMRGLMKNAPELYNVLHGNERKDSKTPSPKQSPPLTPPPPLQRARSPPSPVTPGHRQAGAGLRRVDRLRAEDEAGSDGRSHSRTPPSDAYRRSGERSNVVKVQR